MGARSFYMLSGVILLLLANFACAGGTAEETTVHISADVLDVSLPSYYGVEYAWVDQDTDLFVERIRTLGANVLRVQITQEYIEPVNDNADPNFSEINFGLTIPLDPENGKTLTYQEMFTRLGQEFPEMVFQINMWLPARWNADTPGGYVGLGGTFPPVDYAEHREFVRELFRWLVEDCDIAPARLSFAFVNEPNLEPFFTGSQDDLLRMAIETRAALDAVSPEIGMFGLDEVHGTDWTAAFYNAQPEGCCDGWAYHVYEAGQENLNDALLQRLDRLSVFGPVWITEFASTEHGSPDGGMDFSTEAAALHFSQTLAYLWPGGIDGVIHFRLADTYTSVLGWSGHGLFADSRGTNARGDAYHLYPTYWVFANIYNHLGEGQLVAVENESGLELFAVRQGSATGDEVAVWVVNAGPQKAPVTFCMAAEYALAGDVEILNNLEGSEPADIGTLDSAGCFPYTFPARSAYTLLVR
ncbi:MAG: hypothetical protein JXB38_17270 [Anaerolineales bacterium]|nr:hypothetical protein [Anaerolineales bacterium]